MRQFFTLTTLDNAQKLFWGALPDYSTQTERVLVSQALGRILAATITSQEFMPPFSRSAMDGYAVKADDTTGASASAPCRLNLVGEVLMGAEPGFSILNGEAALIHTGGMLPEGADAVVMVEQVSQLSNCQIEITKAVFTNENVLLKGEDVKPGDLLIEKGTKIRMEEIAGLLALGMNEVEVCVKPRIAILTTGDELVKTGQPLKMGQVYDINSGALAALIVQAGGIPLNYPIVKDDFEELEKAARKAFNEADALLISAGSSVSVRDLSASVIQKLGQPGVLLHGIQLRPGKPTILAVCDGKPVIGVPGNPISALVVSRLFVAPLVRILGGYSRPKVEAVVKATLTATVSSDAGKDEFCPAVVRQISGSVYEADPIHFKSNLIFNLVKANGLIHIPADAAGYSEGSEVDVILI